jgi:hypothetical protein
MLLPEPVHDEITASTGGVTHAHLHQPDRDPADGLDYTLTLASGACVFVRAAPLFQPDKDPGPACRAPVEKSSG